MVDGSMGDMMSFVWGSPTAVNQWAIATVILVMILGLILVYLNYRMLSELKEMREALNKMNKLLESIG